MSKLPLQRNSHQMDSSKKRKRQNKDTTPGFSVESITTSRQLGGLLADFSNPEELNNGIQQFKAFLGRCSKSGDIPEETMKQNLKILKEWLETQIKDVGEGDEGEGQGNAFRGILQVCSYASQNNKLSVLSVAMASLAILVRTCSQNGELRAYGAVLCKAILQPTYLKIVYRNLVSSKDHVASPTLRTLTEINKFDFGSVCGLLHSTFDFTTKDITKNLEVRGGKGETTIATDDLHRPSLRTTFVRFFLSFFQYGSSSVKTEVLAQRAWVSTLFKYLRLDSPLVVYDILETMDKKVLADKEIPRATKTKVFYEGVLNHILALYSRIDTIDITMVGKDGGKTVKEFSHEFLMKICTTPANGICFADLGWYPLGSNESDEKRHGAPKVYNRTLSLFIPNIRPFADTLQQDLLLEIFKTCPELVASYFLNNSTFSFDPKVTSTWIGYCAFLTSTIQLHAPKNFGMEDLSVIPPPTNIVIENVVPKPLNKATLTKCLQHENSLIRFLVTRLLLFAFQKLQRVLSAIDDASVSMVDPTFNWSKARFDLAGEFCKRVPDMPAVVGLVNSASRGGTRIQGKLQREAASRLLADYYELIPEVALAGKFDITIALGSFLVDENGMEGDSRGLKLLEMGHLLRVAHDIPDIKWWSKSASMPFSPFVSILKIFCGPTSNIPLRQIRNLLHSFLTPSNLFQSNTPVSPLEALLESLSSILDPLAINDILSFLDESVTRCIRSPFKYIDDYSELALGAMKSKSLTGSVPAVSPLIMTLVEQWEFFMNSGSTPTVKHAASIWLVRLLESIAILGENKYVLAILCNRLAAACKEAGHLTGSKSFGILKSQLEGGEYLELGNNGPNVTTPEFESNHADPPSFLAKWPRALFNGIGYLDIGSIELVKSSIKERKTEVSLFDIAVVQKAILGVLDSQKISSEDSHSALLGLIDLLETILVRFKEEGGDSTIWGDAKKMLATDNAWVESFLGVPTDTHKYLMQFSNFPRYAYFSKRYSNILAKIFNGYEPILSDICERAKHSLEKMGRYFEQNPDDPHCSEVLSTYNTTITRLFSSDGILDFIRNVVLVKDDPNELEFDILALLLQQLSSRNKHLPIKDLETLLETPNAPRALCDALTEYILSIPKDSVASLDIGPYNMNFEAELHEWTISLDCALIRQVESVHNTALVTLDENLQNGKNIPHLSRYLAALLEGISVPKEDTKTFEWEKSADAGIKQKMERLFSAVQESMFDGPPDIAQIGFLQMVASLFSSFDRKLVLKHITSDNRRSTLTAKTVTLLGTLIQNMDSEELEATELQSWLLMVFDHLTRRFSEDETISENIVDFTKQLGRLLYDGKISLTSSVPRVTLNAILEAGLLKHIDIPEVVYFVTVMVSQLPAKFLDLGKLLQIVLGHAQNPLLLRDSCFGSQEISHHTAYLIYRLFSIARSRQSNITTLDGVLSLYRGSNDIIDTMLLDIITAIEAHLARSCATRVASWSIVENAEGTPLISRTRGHLNVVIDAKTLARSVFQSSPNRPVILEEELENFDSFMAAARSEDAHFSKTYDLEFILPALAFLISDGQVVDIQVVIERHCLGLAIMGLCSDRITARKMAIGYISSIAAKLEDSNYREKTQMLQIICALLASINAKEVEDSQPGLKAPIPTIIGVFIAQAVQVVANPAHFLYKKVMELLLNAPLLDLYDLPRILQISLDKGDEYQKEIVWILNVLAAGLRTTQDLDIYRKRNVFGGCLNLYNSPYCIDRYKEKIIVLLWNTAEVEGGGTTLITRNGILSFIEQQQCISNEKGGLLLKRLAARIYESSVKRHVKEWGMGNVESHLTEGIFVN